MPFVVSRYLALLFGVGLAIAETVISWGNWQFAPLWFVDYLMAVLLLYAYYKTRNAEHPHPLLAVWAFTVGVFYMDLFVNLDPHMPAHLRPGSIVMVLIALSLVITLVGFFTALMAIKPKSTASPV